MRSLYCCLVLSILVLSAGVASAAGYSANGFESFTLGDLNGQDGWDGSVTSGGEAPRVVAAPDPVLGSKAVRLYVGDAQGDASDMHRAITPIEAVSGTVVTVSYDIYRPMPAAGMVAQNMWWWWDDAGTPTYGLQWDIGGTLPNGWNPGAGTAPTVYDRYANVKMVWDFTQMKAYSWYDGNIVDNGIDVSGITTLTGWAIHLAHESDNGTGASTAYIDNFSIGVEVVPEPASLLALASGLIGLGGLAIRRRR